jgi:hypothetical protein
MIRKIRSWLFYRKCEEHKKNDGFACFVCTATTCFRNRFLSTLKYWNGKCVEKGCENPRLKDAILNQYCEEHQKK